jgi:hypothetical protein
LIQTRPAPPTHGTGLRYVAGLEKHTPYPYPSDPYPYTPPRTRDPCSSLIAEIYRRKLTISRMVVDDVPPGAGGAGRRRNAVFAVDSVLRHGVLRGEKRQESVPYKRVLRNGEAQPHLPYSRRLQFSSLFALYPQALPRCLHRFLIFLYAVQTPIPASLCAIFLVNFPKWL